MQYDSNFHHRRSIRLKTYDYSNSGAYFVTICTYKKECVFGEIEKEEMRMNDLGKMVESTWNNLSNRFLNTELDQFIMMPNHIHGIIWIIGRGDPCDRPPIDQGNHPIDQGECKIRPYRIGTTDDSIGRMIQAFKSISTVEYIRYQKKINPNQAVPKLWHRNYYERIIRCDAELFNIRKYILDNTLNWNDDPERNKKNAPLPILPRKVITFFIYVSSRDC